MSDGWVYYAVGGGSGAVDQLWRTRENEDAERLTIDASPFCERPALIRGLFPVGDQLGLGILCEVSGKVRLVTYSSEQGVNLLATSSWGGENAAWTLEGDMFVGTGSGPYCRRIAKVDNNGEVWMDVATDSSSNVQLMPSSSDAQCADSTAAGLPATSANGQMIAFVAAREGNIEGNDGLLGETVLYYGEVGGELVEVATVDDPHDLAISPDGQTVGIATDYRGTSALWIIEIDSGRATMVATGSFGPIDFSPDSRRIVSPGPSGSALGSRLEVTELH